MKRRGLGLLAIISALVLITALVGCGKSNLVGKWVPKTGQDIPSSFPEKGFELLKDGSGAGDGYSLTWKTENSRLLINVAGVQAYVFSYRLNGAELILTDDNGKSITYSQATSNGTFQIGEWVSTSTANNVKDVQKIEYAKDGTYTSYYSNGLIHGKGKYDLEKHDGYYELRTIPVYLPLVIVAGDKTPSDQRTNYQNDSKLMVEALFGNYRGESYQQTISEASPVCVRDSTVP